MTFCVALLALFFLISYDAHTINGIPSAVPREVIVNRGSEEATLDEFKMRGGRGNSLFVASLPPWMIDEGLSVGDRFIYVSTTCHLGFGFSVWNNTHSS